MLSSVNDTTFQFSNGVNSFWISGYPIGDNSRPNLSDGMQSSWRLEICNVHDSSLELSGSLEVQDLSDNDIKEDVVENFQRYMHAICECMASDSASCMVSSESNSFEEDCLWESPGHVRRPSSCNPKTKDLFQEQSDPSKAESIIPVRHMAVQPGKKGTCYRCLKGNRFTEKEVCIVCGAKYCCNCVLKAMGSMPEGRKCVTCIGQRIDESKRKTLGKCSSMLKQLGTELEVERIMTFEKLCDVNQLPLELVYVNGESLSQSEINILQTCPNPPTKLKPGRYWYDNVSGFWGKEGEKPCQIISPQMNVGGHIKRDASNGNTNVFKNNREITEAELLMLQWVGVDCYEPKAFWLAADGCYLEEGMMLRGNIWDKPRVKAICTILSLPTPPSSSSLSGEVNAVTSNNLEPKTLHRLLLVGYKNSGTSTIFKQAKIVYNIPRTQERQSLKCMIQSNLYVYLSILLEGRERFEEECLIKKTTHNQFSPSGEIKQNTIYSLGPRLKAISDWLLKVMLSCILGSIFPAAAREYAPIVQELWKDPAIQATYDRRSELKLLPRVAAYFLERVLKITMTDYQPSNMDILYAGGSVSSKWLSSMEFSFPELADKSREIYYDKHNPLLRYQLIGVRPSILGRNWKFLEVFEDVDIVLFCVSLADYDEFEDNNGVLINKMVASKQLFETIVTDPIFGKKVFLLILNKYDLFEEKIEQVPLTRCEWFHDFNPAPINRFISGALARCAFQYITVKFQGWFFSLTNKKLYVSPCKRFEPDSVDKALRHAREILQFSSSGHEFSSSRDDD